jgi:uncharacterized protein YwbE
MALTTIIKARCVYRKRVESGGFFVDIVVWQLPTATPDRPHGLKYRLHCGRGAECIVRYDNETGKGDHRHYGKQEEAYAFKDASILLRDFAQDVYRLTGWRISP